MTATLVFRSHGYVTEERIDADVEDIRRQLEAECPRIEWGHCDESEPAWYVDFSGGYVPRSRVVDVYDIYDQAAVEAVVTYHRLWSWGRTGPDDRQSLVGLLASLTQITGRDAFQKGGVSVWLGDDGVHLASEEDHVVL